MPKNLLIVFAKNIVLGKVKTRLAESIGDTAALNVYIRLFEITERESSNVKNADVHVHFSDVIINSKFPNAKKFVQVEGDLGHKMEAAFAQGFADGYEKIIGIGADLADLTTELIEDAFKQLDQNDFVFGPAQDGGYYLVGTTLPQLYIFENKPWSTEILLKETLAEIKAKNHSVATLETLNDIDVLEDLKGSSLSEEFREYL